MDRAFSPRIDFLAVRPLTSERAVGAQEGRVRSIRGTHPHSLSPRSGWVVAGEIWSSSIASPTR